MAKSREEAAQLVEATGRSGRLSARTTESIVEKAASTAKLDEDLGSYVEQLVVQALSRPFSTPLVGDQMSPELKRTLDREIRPAVRHTLSTFESELSAHTREDLENDTLEKLFRNLATLKRNGLIAWSKTVATNGALDVLRKKGSSPSVPYEENEPDHDEVEVTEDKEGATKARPEASKSGTVEDLARAARSCSLQTVLPFLKEKYRDHAKWSRNLAIFERAVPGLLGGSDEGDKAETYEEIGASFNLSKASVADAVMRVRCELASTLRSWMTSDEEVRRALAPYLPGSRLPLTDGEKKLRKKGENP